MEIRILKKAKEELGERDIDGMMPNIDNEYYAWWNRMLRAGIRLPVLSAAV